jgi:type IV pilus assembly protein PilC
MIYPVSLIVIAIIAVIYLFGFVLPGIFDTLSGSVTEMPAITMMLKNFSDFIVNYWQSIAVFGILLILLVITYSATEKGKKQMYRTLVNMPIVGSMTKSYYLIKWSRYMKLMI